jgi:flagellar hook-associated protein 1
MALGIAWDIAKSGLSAASGGISVVSKNVANAQNPNASRKYVEASPQALGGVRLTQVGRVESRPLLEAYLTSSSTIATSKALLEGAERLSAAAGDAAGAFSPASLLSKLEGDLRLAATRPSDAVAARSVLSTADALAKSLNAGSDAVAQVRVDADRAIAASVETVNGILLDLERANANVLEMVRHGRDATDALDDRDALLKTLSAEIGIRVAHRPDHGILVYSDGGNVLFETTARQLTFQPTAALPAGGSGNQIYIDGVQATGQGAVMPLASGRLKGLVELRDDLAVSFGNQLDEFARGLVEAFADRDRVGGGNPDLPGLFTWQGGSVQPSGVLVPGIASSIRISPGLDPASGGDLRRLRDGGASAPGNPAYNANPTGAPGFSGRLDELVAGLSSSRAFSASANLAASGSLFEFASGSVGWIEETRQSLTSRSQTQGAVQARAVELLAATTGANIDREMSDMLELERAYQASSRLLTTIDSMLQTLFSALR